VSYIKGRIEAVDATRYEVTGGLMRWVRHVACRV